MWVEKDALFGIVERICSQLDVSFFSCRGYVSQSEMWSASQRLLDKSKKHEKIVLLHLGDHDPSGKDMSRDIVDRLRIFECWELDALEPNVITNLIQDNVLKYRDETLYNKVKNKENIEKEMLDDLAENWGNIAYNWGKIKDNYC